MGTLFEDVLTTGTLLNRMIYYNSPGQKAILAAEVATTGKDLEAGHASPILFGKGQLLVLTRRVDTGEANRLQNLGYRFANIEQVGDQLARSLQVSRDDLESLTSLSQELLRTACPMVKLSNEELDIQEIRLLATFNGLTLDDCLKRISQRTLTGSDDDIFLENFRDKMYDLLRECPETALNHAFFSARQLDVAHDLVGHKDMTAATVFAFCGIKEIYVQSLQSLTLKTIPLSLFQTYLRSYPGCPDHAILAQKNHKEFSSLQRVSTKDKTPNTRSSGLWPSNLLKKAKPTPTEMPWQGDSSSEKGLVHVSQSPPDSASHPWGSIMVTSTQNMTIYDGNKDGAAMEMRELGVKSEVGMAETERPTLADRLMSITTGFRDPHAARALPKDLVYGRR
ncbi:hypothetical protein SNOG_04996 [Parastagonospora nodorum SN15]|uniref:Uncharacterized protein n=1 Tax=Phaeosphaeria nodorum (strain SN15 / ATCC MYA-4574 / FGSC 10173) TaxID=321614 RepID=Q0UTB8_PHANO|nr:hypothetical protein SNOG_04996 [Parastagonospora nodorum SN15]EAT87387.2 hypothetical protein SNOG_04996 [Parastagonospora nodorum SN15]